MTVVVGETTLPDKIGKSILPIFQQCDSSDDNEHPKKRRKLARAGPKSLSQENGVSETGIPLGYIPLARLTLRMKLPETVFRQHWIGSTLQPQIPVLVKAREVLLLDQDPQPDTGGEPSCMGLEITDVNQNPLVSYMCDTPGISDLLEQIELASKLTSADRISSRVPVACYQARLCASPENGYINLEIVVLWANASKFEEVRQLQDPVLEVFTKYVLREKLVRPSNPISQRERREVMLGVLREWSPREFYNSVHVPQTPDNTAASLTCPDIDCSLFPFQKRAVRWLLQREGKDVQEDGQIGPVEDLPKSSLPASFDRQKDADGNTYFFSQLFMALTTDISQWSDAADHLKGGILAEEMGLGKTVEMIALICLNRRSARLKADPDGLKPSGATLIITPPAILEQWKQELQQHAPSLSVYHYTGIKRAGGIKHEKERTDEMLVNELAEFDVVLTTYNVISAEIHYAGAVPTRSLRHEKRFEQRKTPLVRISWWRVCLDEAQMVESGVSHAAQVARVIPRENAWAITGTPLRKNIDDLFGLLLFLHYGPYCFSNPLWKRLCSRFGFILVGIINTIALRHSKDRVRDELRLPRQKRVVITTPFTAVEEQHYGQSFEKMCAECGLDATGAPLQGDWDPQSPWIIEKMRTWLTTLRQTCLYPQVGGSSRRALGTTGPLRTVDEVLEVMIENNEVAIRTEERSLLLSQLRRGQLLENAKKRRDALALWQRALDHSAELVKDSREQLRLLKDNIGDKEPQGVSGNDYEESDKNSRLGQCRLKLRAALEVQHIAVFFTANAYYQIKSDPALTQPDSDEFKALEKRESDGYEAAKIIRKEMLTDISQKVERYMKVIKEKTRNRQFVQIPKMKPQLYSRGIESFNLLGKFEDLCEALNKHAEQYEEWREIMIGLVSQSLIDQEEDTELEGDEYERSTKHQDEMYVYMEALRSMYADRHDALTGQNNVLISHEVKAGIVQAQKGEGPSPKLFLRAMDTRSQLIPDPELGSLRRIVSDLRSLLTSLDWQASSGNSRAGAEYEVVEMVLKNAGQMIADQLKVSASLERELEMFRDTMNNRLEYYRHLQQISDTVAPYDEESVGMPLDEQAFSAKLAQEELTEGRISSLKSKARYLVHLRDDSSAEDSARICIICQSSFEVGVLTVCGHKFCTDCLRLWWVAHRNCPVCKRGLKHKDFHQITYKPQDLLAQEEDSSIRLDAGGHSQNAIYSDISSGLLKKIKNVDLVDSYGTKIDTLARHIIWLRAQDPGAKSIVFSQYKTFLTVLQGAFDRFGIASTTVDNREGIEKFKKDPAVECFLLHGKAQSSGLTLINATHVFLCEPLINTAIELQAIARVHRIGQHRPTTVWMYLVSGTVEESIYELSVTRRMAHIIEKEKRRNAPVAPVDGNDPTVKDLTETAIDSANSMELQDSRLGDLMQNGAAGGEMVKKDDLWQCLFGNIQKDGHDRSTEAEREVGRFLRGDAAEQRADQR